MSHRLFIPAGERERSVYELEVSLGTKNALLNNGVRTLGQLHQVRLVTLLMFRKIGLKKATEITRAIERLAKEETRTENANLVTSFQTHISRTPLHRMPLLETIGSSRALEDVRMAVRAATTIQAEVHALVSQLSERDAALVLGRWCYSRWPQPTLERLGREFGITRERVRQIIDRVESTLRAGGVPLPKAALAVSILNRRPAGGQLASFLRSLRRARCDASIESLRTLPQLAKVGLIEPITRLPAWLDSGRQDEIIGTLREEVRKSLRLDGVVPMHDIEHVSLFRAEEALALVAPGGAFIHVADYLIPIPSRSSRLVRTAQKVLAVTKRIRVADFCSGVQRELGRKKTPPRRVVETVLSHSRLFRVKDGILTGRRRFSRSRFLSGSEIAAVRLLERHGDVMPWHEFLQGILKAHFSAATAHAVLRSACFRRAAPRVYALRGRSLAGGFGKAVKRS
jgi:hypothetical protein